MSFAPNPLREKSLVHADAVYFPLMTLPLAEFIPYFILLCLHRLTLQYQYM